MKTPTHRLALPLLLSAASLTHAASIKLENPQISIVLDDAFPRICQYSLKSTGATLLGQTTPSQTFSINQTNEPASVAFKKLSNSTAQYTLEFPQSNITLTLTVTLDQNCVDLKISKVLEKGTTKFKTLSLPGSYLVSIDTSSPHAELAAVSASGYANSSETLGLLTTLNADNQDHTGNHVFLSNGNLAAGIAATTLTDTQRVGWKISPTNQHKTAIAWSPYWQYREIDSETLPTPTIKVILAGDLNHDQSVNWQDACLAYRSAMPKPYGAEKVKSYVGDQIAMNFASLAQQPFLRILDEIKRSYLLTDGLPQNVTIKGFTAEGHDSANTDYSGHYNQRAGGLKDLTTLLKNSATYNTRVGVHINATEAYPEAHRYNPETLAKSKNGQFQNGWAWMDQSHLIDKRKDVLSGELHKSLAQMRKDLPDLQFIYLDVYGESGWTGWQTAKAINDLKLPLHTEYSTALDPWTTWSHLRKINGNIYRFLWFSERDLFAFDPILRGGDHVGFMGWQNERSYQGFLQCTFGKNLPTKYLQHFSLLSWQPGQSAEFSNKIKITKTGDSVICTKDGNPIMTWSANGSNNRLFIPWDPIKESKIYAWDEVGTQTSWQLPKSWQSCKSIYLYQLSATGRSNEQSIPVTNGSISITLKKNTAYVIDKNKSLNAPTIQWGEGSLVADPGFDSYSFDSWKKTPQSATPRIEALDTGDSRLVIDAPSTEAYGVQQTLKNLTPGKTYHASVWVQSNQNRIASLSVAPNPNAPALATNSVTNTPIKNLNDSDSKFGTHFQRLRVTFTQPKNSTTATLSLLAGPSTQTAMVEFDDVRIVPASPNPDAKNHAFFEDFEDVDQGLGPFVYTSKGQTQTHLSETNSPHTHDTIGGKYSFKTYNEPAGPVVQSLPNLLPLKPNTEYTLTLDTLADSDIYHLIIQSDPTQKESTIADLPIAKGQGKISHTFKTQNTHTTVLSLIKSDKGGGQCVLDHLIIDEK